MVSQILTGCIGHIPRLGGPETGTVFALHSLVDNYAGALAGTSPIGTWLWADANQAEKAVLWDLATTPAASKTAEGAFQDNPDSIRGLEGVSLQDKSARHIFNKAVEKVQLLPESDDWAQELLRDTWRLVPGVRRLSWRHFLRRLDRRMGQQDPQSRCLVHFGWLERTARCDSHDRQRSLQEHQSVCRENSEVEEKQAGLVQNTSSSYPSSPDRSVPEGTAAAQWIRDVLEVSSQLSTSDFLPNFEPAALAGKTAELLLLFHALLALPC